MSSFTDLPSRPGSYALHLVLSSTAHLMVGRLGTLSFPAGDYLYLGSAFGPGGLRARLRHHLSSQAAPRWHLDYLRPVMVPLGGWYTLDARRMECTWSQVVCELPGVAAPAPGFGAADCTSGCAAHLLRFSDGIDARLLEEQLRSAGGEAVAIQSFLISS